jgi:homoserine kinase
MRRSPAKNRTGRRVTTRGAGSGGQPRSIEVRVPASAANLGAGFDCFGLALELFLTVRATVLPQSSEPIFIDNRGEPGSENLPREAEKNLIVRAMRAAAERYGLRLPPLRLNVHNGIPLTSGLGSSAAAIVTGITLCSALNDNAIPDDAALALAAELEGHADNVAAALHGGFVVTSIGADGKVLALRRPWPREIRVLVVTPHATLETSQARAVLPTAVSRSDAVHNLQRAALFCAAIEEGRHNLLWEAMQDKLHQPYRAPLVPGLAEALATPRLPGLLGIALSGAGPSVIALANANLPKIGEAIASRFRGRGIEATIRQLAVCQRGTQLSVHKQPRANRHGARR